MNKIARFMLCTMGVFCVSQYTLLLTSSIARAQLISEAPRLENEAEVLSPTPGMGTSTPERTRSIPVGARADDRPQPPDTGTPIGDTTPPVTRPEATCKPTSQPLTAIVANQGRDLTTSANPTFLFYIPYNPEDINSITFSINKTEGETIYRDTETVYRTNIQLTETSGIIKISIPPQPEYALKSGELYHWYLTASCTSNNSDDVASQIPELVVDGWVRRLPMDSEKEFWQDEIARLAELYFAEPDNLEYQENWEQLLQNFNMEGLLGIPLVESKLVPPEN